MSVWDTTATCQQDARIDSFNTTSTSGSAQLEVGEMTTNQSFRSILSFRLPPKPTGIDRIKSVFLVLTVSETTGTAVARTHSVYKVSNLWTESGVTWTNFATGQPWNTAGGDLGNQVGVSIVSGSANSSFAYDITTLGLDWDQGASVIVKSNTETTQSYPLWDFRSTEYSTATPTLLPHIVVRAEDDPPAAINDLCVEPDISLTESSYTHRQRVVLKWSASDENDFKRYRIRYGINRSQASDHVHKTFIGSRGSTTYLDPTIYTDGSTIYYSLTAEDRRNGSTSTALGATFTNTSNIASWTKPAATIGRVSPSSSASTLDSVECDVRAGTMSLSKRAKIVWGDGAWTLTGNQTSAGGYFYARHRYTKATSGYTIRAAVEDVFGFRSGLDSYATNIVIANLGPVAKIIASPTRTKTASTFSFGETLTVGATGELARFRILTETSCPADGLLQSLTVYTAATVTSTNATFVLLRYEGGRYRVVDLFHFTTSTANQRIRRNIGWRGRRGDYLACQMRQGQSIYTSQDASEGLSISLSSSSTIMIGQTIDRWRALPVSFIPSVRISYALTNAISFSSKDSYARGSNKFINRFRWMPDYAGDFSAGATYTTGATTSFDWAWTSATTAFMAVRAVDDTHASSTDHIGVVVETESTFRIPDDLRDGVSHISSTRSRAYTHPATLGVRYGIYDSGEIEPTEILVGGESYTLATGNSWIDADRISAVFQQDKRVLILPPWSTSTYVSAYAVESPVIRDIGDMIAKSWSLRLRVPNQ